MEIPVGAIPVRVPRPLTDEEKALVSDRRAEQLSNSGKLEALLAKRGKRVNERQRRATKAAMKKPTSSLYVKDDER